MLKTKNKNKKTRRFVFCCPWESGRGRDSKGREKYGETCVNCAPTSLRLARVYNEIVLVRPKKKVLQHKNRRKTNKTKTKQPRGGLSGETNVNVRRGLPSNSCCLYIHNAGRVRVAKCYIPKTNGGIFGLAKTFFELHTTLIQKWGQEISGRKTLPSNWRPDILDFCQKVLLSLLRTAVSQNISRIYCQR